VPDGPKDYVAQNEPPEAGGMEPEAYGEKDDKVRGAPT
jgi:hypothetical protein